MQGALGSDFRVKLAFAAKTDYNTEGQLVLHKRAHAIVFIVKEGFRSSIHTTIENSIPGHTTLARAPPMQTQPAVRVGFEQSRWPPTASESSSMSLPVPLGQAYRFASVVS